MAKRLVKTTEELVNFAQDYRIETEGKSIQNIAQELSDKLMSYYDEYYMYIDNGRQMREAEQRNHEIEEEVAAIKKLVDTLPVQEETTMKTNSTTTNHNETVKEETIMTNTTNDLTTRTLNMNRVERLMHVRDSLTHATKTTDEFYIKKEELVQFLFDNDIISRMPGKNKLKKTKRQEFVDILMAAVQNLIDAKVITPINAVPVGDLDITHDNAPAQDVTIQPKKQKSDLCFHLIKTHALENQKKGYGHTISAYMLCAYILQAGYGMQKLKGHENEVTDEMKQTIKDVRRYMVEKKLIIPVTYKAADGKAYYTPEYDGADGHKKRMSPVNANMSKVQVSTYKVQW